MACSQNRNVIQMLLFQSILPAPTPRGKGWDISLFTYILDPNYVFTPPETPAKCPQQQVSAPRMPSGDCLHMFTYPALPEIPPAYPALPSGTLSMCTILPAQPKYSITNPNQPWHNSKGPFFWVVGNTRCRLMICVRHV